MTEGFIHDGYGDKIYFQEQAIVDTDKDDDIALDNIMHVMTSDEIAAWVEGASDNLQLARQATAILRERLFASTSPKEHHEAANRVWFVYDNQRRKAND